MASIRYLAVSLAVLFGLVSAATNVTAPVPPSQDPWYTPPEGWRCQAPGAPLRVRPAPGNISAIVSGVEIAYNIMYRTTDSQYQPSWAVTTLYIPENANSKALVNYQTAYDSHHLDDSPSHAIYTGGIIELAAWAPCIALGWYLNVPDYEGPNASFTAGVASGHATIDSVRVVLSLKEQFGIDDDAQYAMWGYSGGALATEWAAELQGQYAPEMNFSGAAMGGLTPNVTNVLYHITKEAEAGLAFSSIWGLTSQYPGSWEELLKRINTDGAQNVTGWLDALAKPVNETTQIFAYQDLAKYFINGFNFLVEPLFAHIWNTDGVMGYHGTPNMPLYVYKAIQDQVSPISDTDDLVDRYCLIGANILYERNSIGGHTDEATNGAYAAFFWLYSIFTGSYASSYNATGCTIRDVASNYTDTGA
ncbi:lipase 1 [Thozetella sp. PMI_491]|nr:lipase 1 [Thozetella sp. PMI_491]